MNSTYFLRQRIQYEKCGWIDHLKLIVGGDRCESDVMYTVSDICKWLVRINKDYIICPYIDETGIGIISYVGIMTYEVGSFHRVRMVNINKNQFTIGH